MNLNPYATVIAYFDGLEGLWFAEIPESRAELGSVIDISILQELSSLPQDTQQEIKSYLKDQSEQ